MQSNAAFETTFGSLAKPSGLARLQTHLESKGEPASPEELAALQQYVQSEVTEEPALDNVGVRVKPTYGGGQFFPRSRRIHVTKPTDLTALSHEVGHAKSIDKPDSVYNTLQRVSRSVLKAQKQHEALVLPLLMTLPMLTRSSVGGPYRALIKKILGGATIGSLAAGAPVLYEEAQASLNSLQHVPEKTEAIKRLLPNFLDYARVAAVPALAYYVTKRLV
jgi:hypothetical protein